MSISSTSKTSSAYWANIPQTRSTSSDSFSDALRSEQGIVNFTDPVNQKWFETAAPNAPQSVQNAWNKATADVGVSGFGISSDGDFSYVPQIMATQAKEALISQYRAGVFSVDGKVDSEKLREWSAQHKMDYLGDTVSSAKEACKNVLNNLENPGSGSWTAATSEQLEKERTFYTRFLTYLNQI